MAPKNKKTKELTTTNATTNVTTNVISTNVISTNVTTPIKAKRGRKSKKELMASLNITYFLSNEKDNKSNQVQTEIPNIINLDVSEI